MELSVLNPDFTNKTALIENFESFIWTDRFSDIGDLTLVTDPSLFSLLSPGTFIGFDESNHTMEVKSTLRAKDATGKNVLTVKGKSIEDIFNYRMGMPFAPPPPNWLFWDTVGHFITEMVRRTCTPNSFLFDTKNAIPYLVVSDLSGIVVPQTITAKCEPLLYTLVKAMSDAFNLGFRIRVTLGSPPVLTFEVYAGTDRSGIGGVVFSESLENLSQTSYLASNDKFYNSAFIYSVNGWDSTGDPSATGLQRKMMTIDATDVTDAYSPALDTLLIERATIDLAQYPKATFFDGVINPSGILKINRDFFLGDLVGLIGDSGEKQTARVTEHIWSCDANGYNSYPTLTAI